MKMVLVAFLLIFHCFICAGALEYDDKITAEKVPTKTNNFISDEIQKFVDTREEAINISGTSLTRVGKEFEIFEDKMTELWHKTMEGAAQGIIDLIKAYLTKDDVNFEIHFCGDLEKDSLDQLNFIYDAWYHDPVAHALPLTIGELELTRNKQGWDLYLLDQFALIFIDINQLKDFVDIAYVNYNFTTNLRYLIFVERLLTDRVIDPEDFMSFTFHRPRVYYQFAMPFFDIIYKDGEEMSLWTFTWFELCGETTLKQINTYDMETLEWKEELNVGSKFADLNGCELIVASISDISPDVEYRKQEPQAMLMEVVSNRLNFTEINTTDVDSNHLVIELAIDLDKKILNVEVVATFTKERLQLIIPHAEPYNSYEKMLKPFDETTWYLLIVTFGVAFGSIFAVSLLKRKWQDIVYGEGVRIPAYNVLGTFFGIGQSRLPTKFFARAVLMNFIWFCLIFRTAYQGVFYEMMTTDMRKAQPTNFSELIERNYTIKGEITDWIIVSHLHAIDVFRNYNKSQNEDSSVINIEISEIQKRNFTKIHNNIEFHRSYNTFFENICENIKNSSSKIAYLMGLDVLEHVKKNCTFEPPILDQVMYEKSVGVGMPINHILFTQIANVAQRLVEAGIMQHWYDFYKFLVFRFSMDEEDDGPTVLTLEKLSFGFIIWLGTCGVAVVAFVWEIVWCLIFGKPNFDEVKVHPVDNEAEEIHHQVNIKKITKTFRVVKAKEPFAADKPLNDDKTNELVFEDIEV